MKNNKSNRGLIYFLILILIALIILGYYGISVRSAVENPTTQDNVSYIWTGTVNVWDDYLQVPVRYLWNIFVNDIWTPAIIGLEGIKNGQPVIQNTTGNQLPSP
jgi:Ethanolamine utilization protein EutJ (predicted chaperonin)